MTDYRCMFSTSDRHRKLNQVRWKHMCAHLTNKTSYLLKKRLVHLNWAIYNVCDLNIDPHICFFPTLPQDRAQPIPIAQPVACPRRSERPVRARSPHRSRNGYPGWTSAWVAQVAIRYHGWKCLGPFAKHLILTHWGRVTHICVANLVSIGSDNGLSPDRHRAIIWT